MNNQPKNALLDIYSASAGSGKTYTLAMQFIDLLINNPRDYEHILAVTFTKKATAEMKERIIDNLFLLANKPTTAEQEAKRNALMLAQRKLSEKNGRKLTDNDIAERCGRALLFFLNDFSQFNISTIDSFVQRVIRAFAYEANLPAQYGITLEKEEVINNAIDNLMVEMKTNKQLENWLLTYVRKAVDEGKMWNPEKNIKGLCSKFFDLPEANDRAGHAMPSIDEIKEFDKTLVGIITDAEKRIVSGYKSVVNKLLAINGLIGEVNKRSSFAKNLEKELTDKEIIDFYNMVINGKRSAPICETFFNKKHPVFDANEAAVRQIFLQLADVMQPDKDYFTACEVRNNIYVIGLWDSVKRNIDEISKRNGEMPINETNMLLSKLINNTDVPFIYEKVGSRFKNIMIDEFQDTSRVQWNNFRPLVRNCVDNNEKALVVGDVKQAIYRWRQSDWQLLATQVERDTPLSARTSLDTNWRSEAKIISFNNTLFEQLGSVLTQKIEQITNSTEEELNNIYGHCQQLIPEEKKARNAGYVRLQFNQKPTRGNSQQLAADSSSDDANNNDNPLIANCEQIVEIVQNLHDKGYAYRDICLLVRGNKEGAVAMQVLSEAQLPIISSDSLSLDSSPVVKAIVSHMQFIESHNRQFTLAHALEWQDVDGSPLLSQKLENRKTLGDEILKLRGLGLIELTEAIIRLLPPQEVENQLIYVEAFQNCVFQYAAKHHVNLSDFLDYYETAKDKIKVEAPDNQDAIQLMTIHKSKGLQFRVVLMPYANWNILPKGLSEDYIWTKLPAPFDIVSPMPLKITQALRNTHAEKQYREELRMKLIDNINLLYVAFTRAEEMLYVWSVAEDINADKEFTLGNVGAYLFEAVKQLTETKAIDGFEQIVGDEEQNNSVYILGEQPKTAQSKNRKEEETLQIKLYDTNSWSDTGRISIHNESEVDGFASQHNIIAYGNTMHHIMERIVTTSDIEISLQQAVLSGEIDQVQCSALNSELRQRLTHTAVAAWFDGSMQRTQTEVEFVTAEQEYRPDRIMTKPDGTIVVVDYKFGNHKSNKYLAQVRQYMNLINNVGFSKVEGFIWYYETNELTEVTPEKK